MNALAGAVWDRIPGQWSVILAARTECADVREGLTPNGIEAEPIIIRKAVRQDYIHCFWSGRRRRSRLPDTTAFNLSLWLFSSHALAWGGTASNRATSGARA